MWPFSKKKRRPDAAMAMTRAIIIRNLVGVGLITPPPEVLAQMLTSFDDGDGQDLLGQFRGFRTTVIDALKSARVWSSVTSTERAYLGTSPERVTEQQAIDVTWLTESGGCLLWALGHVEELPAYDEGFSPEPLKQLAETSVEELLAGATLRSEETLDEARSVAELWHWRSRTRELQESGQPVEMPEGWDFFKIIRTSAEQAAQDGLFADPLGSDFPARGKPYRDLEPEEWAEIRSIAVERHRALNWLCGYAPRHRWDETPTDT